MVGTLQRDLDPLDLEIVERAVQGVSDAIKAGPTPSDLESDEELELALRGEVAEMVRASGVSDADVLLDILLEGMSGKIGGPKAPAVLQRLAKAEYARSSEETALKAEEAPPRRRGFPRSLKFPPKSDWVIYKPKKGKSRVGFKS
jgi:hypothetical protein